MPRPPAWVPLLWPVPPTKNQPNSRALGRKSAPPRYSGPSPRLSSSPAPLAKRQSTGFDGLVWTLSSVHAVWSGKPIPARPVTSSEPGFGRAPSAVHDRSQFSRFVAGIPTPTNRLGSLRSSRGHVHDGVATDEIVGGESRQPLAQRALETLFR